MNQQNRMSQLSFAKLFVKYDFYIIFKDISLNKANKTIKTRKNKKFLDTVPCTYYQIYSLTLKIGGFA